MIFEKDLVSCTDCGEHKSVMNYLVERVLYLRVVYKGLV